MTTDHNTKAEVKSPGWSDSPCFCKSANPTPGDSFDRGHHSDRASRRLLPLALDRSVNAEISGATCTSITPSDPVFGHLLPSMTSYHVPDDGNSRPHRLQNYPLVTTSLNFRFRDGFHTAVVEMRLEVQQSNVFRHNNSIPMRNSFCIHYRQSADSRVSSR